MLAKRAAAVLARDEAAFMDTVAGADASFTRVQRRLFDALSTVPIETYELEARWDRYGDLGVLARTRYPTAAGIAIPVVEERYGLRGMTDESVEDLFYTFVKDRRGVWRIAADTDLDDFGFNTARHLWDYGRVAVNDVGPVSVLSHRCTTECDTVDAIAGLAGGALRRVGRYWPIDDLRVAVVVPSTHAQLERMLQAHFDLDDFVAFAVSSLDTRRAYEFVGPRVVVNPPALTGRSRDDVVMILAHELLHVATRPSAGAFTPVWVEEGFANYAGTDAAPPASAESDGRLPADYEFTSGGSDAIFGAYQEGHSAVAHFVQRHGLAAFKRFYRKLGAASFRAGTSRYHIDRALRAVTGSGFRQFERDWASSIAA